MYARQGLCHLDLFEHIQGREKHKKGNKVCGSEDAIGPYSIHKQSFVFSAGAKR